MTPIPSATLVLMRDTRVGIEVLIAKRNLQNSFLGGFWVFPGGAVEKEDLADSELLTAINAAVRETIEEAGIAALHSELLPMSKWVTPEGNPKRFSTWFFVAKADSQPVMVDGYEITDSLWIEPKKAIQKYQQQEFDMLPPTLVSLSALTPFNRVDDALNHYRNRKPLSFSPLANFNNDQLVMLYPGDAGYCSQDATDVSARHRCIQTDRGWQYINEIGIVL